MQKFFETDTFKKIVYIMGIIIIGLLIFQAGMFIGYKKAGFSYRFGEDYNRTFGRQSEGGYFMGMMRPHSIGRSHGASGNIISIKLPNVVIPDRGDI